MGLKNIGNNPYQKEEEVQYKPIQVLQELK
jgi:hypothetical protein